MRRTWGSRCAFAVLAAVVILPAPAAGAQPPVERPVPAGAAGRPAEPALTAPPVVEPSRRTEILGAGWQASPDRAWLISGDGDGFHVLVADAADGYAWRTAATLSEPGFATDRWIGNACLTGDGQRVVVAYAPRTFTNEPALFDRGAFTAVVRLDTGAVSKLPVASSLAYFSPSCGPGTTAILTQHGGTGPGATRLYRVDTDSAAVSAPIEVTGQLTSAVPTADGGIVAADSGALVRVDSTGRRTAFARTDGVPFQLSADGQGGVVFMDRQGGTAALRRVDATAVGGRSPRLAQPALLGTGPLDRVGVARGAGGRVFLTGEVTAAGPALPGSVQRLAAPRDAVVSALGTAVLTAQTARLPHPDTGGDASVLIRPVSVAMTVRATGKRADFTVTPSVAVDPAGRRAHPTLVSGGVSIQAGSPSNPVEAERYCSVPRNDPRNQAMQPKPRQVEWAADQAITNVLTVSRPANWKNLGMPAYTPQGLFPPIALAGGGRVPAQVFLGIIAQESNMWQAPGSVVPGVTGNPLIGNYYGLELYNDTPADDWIIRWDQADCGYGVSQVTDGMRLAGREKPGEVALPFDSQRAVALDFAANVAAGLRILQSKWNETRAAGMVVNNGDPLKIENWFFAVWAYNSGFHPQSQAGANNGAWGVGWANNPVNPNYPANRAPFLEFTYADAAHPQDWPYPEKVMGWAGHPVEILESPGTLVAGYRPAWWNGDAVTGPANRQRVKPPVTQFCDASNTCQPGSRFTPTDPAVIGEPAGPCAHRNSAGQYDLKCWYHQSNTWKSDCSFSCGNELLRFDPGYAYQDDGTAYPPNCGLGGLPSGALIIDDQPDSVPVVRPSCGRPFTNQGAFTLDFGADASGNYPSKVDFHQLGAGFGGHFYYAHTRVAALRGNSMRVTGTWTLNRTLNQWARVFVHMPDHGAHTQQAQYVVNLGNGTKTRVMLQRTLANRWVSLGSFPFAGTPKVSLSSVTFDGDDGIKPIESEDVAYDAVAFQPLPAKPRNIIVSLGDSYSSGEGASADGGGDYYTETDNNGGDSAAQNACHRSQYAWSRLGVLADSTGTIAARNDAWSTTLEHHLIACSGAQSEQLLPFNTVPAASRPSNAFGEQGEGQYGELSQLDKGFLDENTTLVTFSIGGNDARFAKVLTKCITLLTDVCQDSTLDGDSQPLKVAEPQVITNQVKPSIVTVLQEIKKKAPNAKIMLMGYPLLFENDGQCVVGIGTAEAPWLTQMGNHLATEMSNAVAQARAAGVNAWLSDPRDEFAGQAVCGSPENIHGIVAPWNRTPGESDSLVEPSQQSFHPKIGGQQLYANSMNSTLRQMGL